MKHLLKRNEVMVDLTTGQPIDEALAVFERDVEELEAMAG